MVPVRRVNQLNWGRFVHFRTHKNEHLHRWYSFRHSFSQHLVRALVSQFGLTPGARVLDPFCGSGGTLLACKSLGMSAEGVDRLPFSVFVTNTKLGNYEPEAVRRALAKLTFTQQVDVWETYSDIPLIRKAFTREMLATLMGLREEIQHLPTRQSVKDFLTLAWYGILEETSRTIKDGAFLRIVGRDLDPQSVKPLFLARCEMMISDITPLPDTYAKAFVGDARSLPDSLTLAPFDAVITSPPYPNRHDYTRIYALELLLGHVKDNESLKQLRYRTLRSHVEARPAFPVSPEYKEPHTLTAILTRLAKLGPNDNRVLRMVRGYFEDMDLVFRELQRVSRSGARVAMVVSDVRFCGITIPVGELLSEIAYNVGFEAPELWVLRNRGTTPQQLKLYSKGRAKEMIVVLRRP